MHWVALAIFASVAVIVWRLEVFARQYTAKQHDIRERELTQREHIVSAPPRRDPLPPDLEGIADQETEPWAREQLRAAIQDEYETHGDWDAVRNSFFGVR